MKGQWIGSYKGTNSGNITLELDERADSFVGWAYLYDNAEGYPSSAAKIETIDKSDNQAFKVKYLSPLNSLTGNLIEWKDISNLFPGFSFPNSADVNFKLTKNVMEIAWNTNICTFGKATLEKSKASDPSELIAKQLSSWDEFKNEVCNLKMRDHIFRDQEKSAEWRLRTSFHRNGRADLRTFAKEDIRELHASTINLINHKFALENPLDLAAFYALLQHHGYPTPLLDWSFSPYIAAFFAFSNISKEVKEQIGNCRIFSFASRKFRVEVPQMNSIEGIQPHFSLVEPLAIENLRMSNQQGFFALSNVDDIESHLNVLENLKHTSYLKAFDLPKNLRGEVMQDLERMGITAASLYPGIEGVCSFQRERLF
jgi:FRG domain